MCIVNMIYAICSLTVVETVSKLLVLFVSVQHASKDLWHLPLHDSETQFHLLHDTNDCKPRLHIGLGQGNCCKAVWVFAELSIATVEGLQPK